MTDCMVGSEHIVKGDHTVRAFDADLASLVRMVAELNAAVEKQLRDAVEALIGEDAKLAETVIEREAPRVAIQRQMESDAVLLIARRQPVAYDLRLIVATWETALELSRVGDVARSTAELALKLDHPTSMPEPAKGLRRITRVALRRLNDAVESLVRGDAEKAEGLWRSDHEIDSIYNSLCREFLTYMMADPASGPSALHLLACAKSIESIGDNVTNVADAVHYLVAGRRIEGGLAGLGS